MVVWVGCCAQVACAWYIAQEAMYGAVGGVAGVEYGGSIAQGAMYVVQWAGPWGTSELRVALLCCFALQSAIACCLK